MPLRGKTALVTGGAHRLGRAIVLELAARGVHVAINYHRSEAAAIDTQRCAAGFGVGAERCAADAADPRAVADMVEAVQQRLGSLDFLVASAGVFRRTPFATASEVDWADMMRGCFDVFRVPAAIVAPVMKRRGGAIVAIADVAALRPWADYIPYSVAKSRVVEHTRRLAVELAPEVRVNCILPGPVLFPPGYPAQERRDEIERTLLGREGRAADVARAVADLLDSDYMTGVALPVDGGRLQK